MRCSVGLVCLLGLLQYAGAQLVPVPDFGVRLARGFRISLFSDSDLANDIYAMTLDSRGNVVVTSQGYIRTLLDTDGDGEADTGRQFAATGTGGMGMCFEGTSLYFVGDGGLFRFNDIDGDGVADGPPQRLLSLEFLEHGGHAVRKGPDGYIYVIAGNETTITNEHATLAGSPIRRAEAGALLRLTPDARSCEIIAHGFRNPYDFDFNAFGDIFTYDSDVEADYFLPWYTPTRIYHIGLGGHHSWRLPGWRRSWNWPEYYPDVVDILARLGRGSPTGVECYRHYQFPLRYQNGIFAADWTFGRIYFLPMTPSGASYESTPEVFLEPIGSQGFAPTDLAVSTDGSLLVSIGGRKTRGAVYRIEYVGERNAALNASNWLYVAANPAQLVLAAPQPLDAWSRAYWEPIATQLDAPPFLTVAAQPGVAPPIRVRAIEILTQLHGGLPAGLASDLSRANAPLVRARTAWSLGRVAPENYETLLLALSRDNDPYVRRAALDAVLDQLENVGGNTLQQAAQANLGHPDKRVRQAAARLAAFVPNQPPARDTQSQLTSLQALLAREQGRSIHTGVVHQALSVLDLTRVPGQQTEALRLIIGALGDWNLHNPSVEVYTAYEPSFPLDGYDALLGRIRRSVRPLVSAGDPTLEFEAARLLGMVKDNDAQTPTKLILKFNPRTAAGGDVHYLTVLSRLAAPLTTNAQATIANVLLSLDRKLEGQQTRSKQYWSTRLAEIVAQFVSRHPTMADALLRHPNFALPGHVALVPSLGPAKRIPSAKLFLASASKRPSFVWTTQLIDLLAALPPEEVYPLFRKHWNNLALREELIIRFAAKPEVADRDKFIVGLASPRIDIVVASAGALLQLAPDPKTILPIIKTLQRLLAEPKEQAVRSMLVTLLNHEAGTSFAPQELGAQSLDVKKAYQPVFAWFRQQHPTLAKNLETGEPGDVTNWHTVLSGVPWDKGNPTRGESIFLQRGCQTCHASSTPLGPDLGGAARRFSPYDLFQAIVHPSRDISPQYRPESFQMRSGQTYIGVPIFESADGVIIQASASDTVRLAEEDIVFRAPANVSIMPAGLLNGLSRTELADLYAYLARLAPDR